MPIKVIACECGNSDKIARKVMRGAGLKDWADVPVPKGKAEAKKVITLLSERGFQVADILEHIGTFSNFVIFIGYDDASKRIEWENAGLGKIEHKVRAEAIVQAFAFI